MLLRSTIKERSFADQDSVGLLSERRVEDWDGGSGDRLGSDSVVLTTGPVDRGRLLGRLRFAGEALSIG